MTRADIFEWAGWIGLAGIILALSTEIPGVPEWFAAVGGTAAIFSCWAMLFTRNADEYTRGLWTSAASLAFAAMLVLFLALPFFEGVYDGFRGDESGQDIPAIASIAASIGAFYVGLFWKRLRGGY